MFDSIKDRLLGCKLFLFAIIVFLCSIGLFVRQSLFGFDSYAFKAFVCTGWNKTLGSNPLATYFFELMPCNLLFFKVVMFVSLLLSLWFIFLIVKKFFEERTAWISIFLLLSLSPIMLFEFGKFENELLAYPFIVFAIYSLLNKKWFAGLSGFTASIVFWGWPYYFTFGLSSANIVMEMKLFSGLLPLFGLVFVVPLIFLFKDKKILVGALLSVVMFLWNAKFFIFLMPFLALGLGNLIEILKNREQLQNFVYMLAFFLIIGFNIAFILAQPTNLEHNLIEEAVTYSKENNLSLKNDWSFGYWILDHGIDTGVYGGGSDTNYFLYDKPFVAVTNKDLSEMGCSPINHISSLTRSIKIWKC